MSAIHATQVADPAAALHALSDDDRLRSLLDALVDETKGWSR
ncbi:MAG TPA: hypothetical protein VGM59_13100 [Dongiaceae bacterium]|jgi:hypothetical protein